MIRRLRMTVAALHQRMNKRFTRLGRCVDTRFNTVDGRFNAVDARFKAVDARFKAVDIRFDRLEVRMQAGFDALHDQISSVMRVMAANHAEYIRHFDLIEKRLQDLEDWRRQSEHGGRVR